MAKSPGSSRAKAEPIGEVALNPPTLQDEDEISDDVREFQEDGKGADAQPKEQPNGQRGSVESAQDQPAGGGDPDAQPGVDDTRTIPYARFQEVLSERQTLTTKLSENERALIEAEARAKVFEDLVRSGTLKPGQAAPQAVDRTPDEHIQALEAAQEDLDQKYDNAEIDEAEFRRKSREISKAIRTLDREVTLSQINGGANGGNGAQRGSHAPMESAALRAATDELYQQNAHWLPDFEKLADDDMVGQFQRMASTQVARMGFNPNSEDADYETRRLAIEYAKTTARQMGLPVDPPAQPTTARSTRSQVSSALEQHRQKAGLASSQPPNMPAVSGSRGGGSQFTREQILSMDPDKIPRDLLDRDEI